MKLEITDDKVRAAAESCPDAKRVLEKLFPEVFVVDNIYRIAKPGIGELANRFGPLTLGSRSISLKRRANGNLEGTIYLQAGINWSIEKDADGTSCLVARKL